MNKYLWKKRNYFSPVVRGLDVPEFSQGQGREVGLGKEVIPGGCGTESFDIEAATAAARAATVAEDSLLLEVVGALEFEEDSF